MSQWPAAKASRVLAALFRLGWALKRQTGSHRTLPGEGPTTRLLIHRIRRRDQFLCACRSCIIDVPINASRTAALALRLGMLVIVPFIARRPPLRLKICLI
jgi:hypothetical protein